ncbi:MAG: IclR family transcriptional regulator [Chloroflexia bacterium]|nr:IclR family transcriptional regulator [Chloroflexia bacterium]
MQDVQEARHTVQSVVRACDVLRAFSVERPILGASEIAAQLKLNRTTVHRLLVTLESCGMVRRDPNTQKYTVGTLVLQLSNIFLHQSDVRSTGLPIITALRDATNQTAALHIREETSRITIAQAESRQDLRVTYPDLGEPIPLHLGAPGKVILANLSPAEIEHYLHVVPLIQTTSRSPANHQHLSDELDGIRAHGYAVTHQERRSGVVSIAAPIFDAIGRIVASVNISAPVQRISDEQEARFVPLVVEAGRKISRTLGHSDIELVTTDQ